MNTKYSILLIEDEQTISDFICTTLKTQNYKVTTSTNGTDGLSLIASQCPDIILLDLGLPDMDGLEIIDKVRGWNNTPIIVISARTEEDDKVYALDHGADDYITKPFGTHELLTRIRSAIRYCNHMNTIALENTCPYQAKNLFIDFDKHLVTLNNEIIHLTQIEFNIVELLAKNAGKVLTYNYIITHIWGPDEIENNRILRVNMAHIRRKLERDPAKPEYIFTEVGIGYRML